MEKIIEYRKAYVEVIEIIKRMSRKEREKIPVTLLNNLEKQKDNEYSFEYQKDKTLEEQNLKIETKALLVEIYEKYLAPQTEQEMWKKYDAMCMNLIEQKKRNRYNPDKIFNQKTKTESKNQLPMKTEKKNVFIKILEKIKSKFNFYGR